MTDQDLQRLYEKPRCDRAGRGWEGVQACLARHHLPGNCHPDTPQPGSPVSLVRVIIFFPPGGPLFTIQLWWLKMIDNNDRNKCNNRNNFLINNLSCQYYLQKKLDEMLAWRVWRWLVTSVVRVLGPPWIKYNILPSDAPLNMSHSEFSDVRGNKKLWRGSSWSHMASREWLIRGLGLSPVSLDCLSADKRSLMTH